MYHDAYTPKLLPKSMRYCRTPWDAAHESDPALKHINALIREDERARDEGGRVEIVTRQPGAGHSLSVDAGVADIEGVYIHDDPLATITAYAVVSARLAAGGQPAESDDPEPVARADGLELVDPHVRNGWHGIPNENIAEKARRKTRAAADAGQLELVHNLPPPDLGAPSRTPEGRRAAHAAKRNALHRLIANPWNWSVFAGHEPPKYSGFWIRAHRTRKGDWHIVNLASRQAVARRLPILGRAPDHAPVQRQIRHWAAQRGYAVPDAPETAADHRLPRGVESRSHWLARWAMGDRSRYVPGHESQAPVPAPAEPVMA